MTLIISFSAAKMKIFEFVEARMSSIAPNLSAVVGSATAAKLMGMAGGLTQLSRIPACNLMVLGAQKKTLAGFSSTAILPHTGFVFYTSLVQSLPPDLRSKVYSNHNRWLRMIKLYSSIWVSGRSNRGS